MKDFPNGALNDNWFSSDTAQFMVKMSMLKKMIYEIIVQRRISNLYDVERFSDYLDEYINNWHEYAMDTYEKMRECEIKKSDFTIIPYADVKNYIYATYDYASMLQYADGLLKGIDEEEFEDNEDINDFFIYTINRAFKDRGECAADMINEALVNNNSFLVKYIPVNDLEIKQFKHICGYNIFNNKDKNDLIRSCGKMVEFLCLNLKDSINSTNDIGLIIKMFTSIIDYITCSIIAFTSRIYIITSYAYRFISICENKNINESVFDENDLDCDSLLQCDEIILHDDSRIHDVEKMFKLVLDKHNISYSNLTLKDDNKYVSALNINLLFQAFHHFSLPSLDHEKIIPETELNELVFNLKELLYNKYQGFSTHASSKEEFFNILKNTDEPKPSIDGYKSLLKDLVLFGINSLQCVSYYLSNTSDAYKTKYLVSGYKPSIINDLSTIHNIMGELYRDLATAIFYKIKYFNRKLYQLEGKESQKLINDMKLTNHGWELDINQADVEMVALPNTMRDSSTSIVSKVGILPQYENALLYYEYLMSLPNTDEYFKEAITWQTIFEQLKVFFNRLIQASRQLINNAQFKAAVNWVTTNESQLTSQLQNFRGEMKVFPYKSEINVNEISTALTSAMDNFKAKYNSIKTDKDVDDIIAQFYSMLKGIDYRNIKNNANNDIKNIYANWLLFGNLNKEPTKEISLTSSAAVGTQLRNWIANVKKAVNIHEGFITLNNEINARQQTIVNTLNSSANTSTTTQPAQTAGNGNSPDMPSVNATNNNQQSQQTAGGTQTPQSAQNDKSVIETLKQTAINKMITAVQFLWGDLYSLVTNAITTQYKYIQEYNRITNIKNVV